MLGVGDERWRAKAPAIAKQDEAPDGVDRACQAVDSEPEDGRRYRLRIEIAEIGLAQNGEGGDADENAFAHGREILDLVMTVGMFGVGRYRAQAHRQEGSGRGRHIDDALERVRIERHAAGDEIGGVFEREHDEANGNAGKSEPDDEFHGDEVMRDAARLGQCRTGMTARRRLLSFVQASSFRLQLACISTGFPIEMPTAILGAEPRRVAACWST